VKILENMHMVVLGVWDFLRPHGFKRRDSTFNRWTKDGLCHVLNLQMGIKSLEGEFTSNLGIFVPEVYQSIMNKEPAEFIRTGECMMSARFGDFLDEDDKWWLIPSKADKVVRELIDLLQTYGLPFFIKFPDRQSIIGQFLSFNEKYSVSLRPKLDLALILKKTGQNDEAQKMFNEHFWESANSLGRIDYLKNIAAKHGWSVPG
jgi:hypothetical protein